MSGIIQTDGANNVTGTKIGSKNYADVTGECTAIRVDDVGSGVYYVGFAAIGTATSAASWRIMKIVDSSGDIAITWADGDSELNNIWDNRASLTYV